MPVVVAFKNPSTGEIRQVKCGWSWTIFFFSPFFGIPLFLRGLFGWGIVFVGLWLIHSAMIHNPDMALHPGVRAIRLLSLLPWIWVSAHGNKLTAKRYLQRGWVFDSPDGELTRMAKRRWGTPV
jgi:hypothetical protein